MLKGFSLDASVPDGTIKSNYHTHNYLCGHAVGTVSDYARAAAENGMQILGISDHCIPAIYTYDPYMTAKSMETDYLPQFDEAKKLYGDKIRILKGVETEYFSGHDDFYKSLKSKLDYMVLGQHLFEQDGEIKNSFFDGNCDGNIIAYFDSVIAAIESGLFDIIAHIDVIFYQCGDISKKAFCGFERAVKSASENGVALELNANGIRYHGFKYPTDALVTLCKKYGSRVVVSSDAHDPRFLCDKYTRALYAYAIENGLNLITDIFK